MITNDLFNKGGRLGNQMFQYATLLGIKSKNKYDIVLIDKYLESSPIYRGFNLKEYTVDIADNIHFNSTYSENCHCYDPNVLTVENNTNLRGYFQTEKYFEHCKDLIKQEFSFKEEVLDQVNLFLEPYRKYNLVSIHVRRADYLGLSHVHVVCNSDYYLNAIKLFNNSETYFVVVSDDMPWCKENIFLDNMIFSTGSDLFDLCLQSECNHHIISNSTFSWWGAWLGKNLNKKIIAPERWFAEECPLSDKDIIPDYWIKIKN